MFVLVLSLLCLGGCASVRLVNPPAPAPHTVNALTNDQLVRLLVTEGEPVLIGLGYLRASVDSQEVSSGQTICPADTSITEMGVGYLNFMSSHREYLSLPALPTVVTALQDMCK